MSLRALADANRPLDAMIELALRELGAEVSPTSVKTYASLLDDAIKMDSGETPNEWGEFLNRLPGEDKFGFAVFSVAESIGASTSQAQQFLRLSDAVVDVKSGVPEDEVLASFEADLGEIEETAPGAYSHFDGDSKKFAQEYDAYRSEPDPERPEPQPFEQEGSDGEE
jgi:hypothetical protein